MLEIFKTNIEKKEDAQKVIQALTNILPNATISFDLDDDDKVLRVRQLGIDTSSIIAVVEQLGFTCKIIPDKVCHRETDTTEIMCAFWNSSFNEHKAMWGYKPANSAIFCKNLFVELGIKTVLIPGIGYGRNALVFIENGMEVAGIEISEMAIELARAHYGTIMKIYCGSVTDMPFDKRQYGGIFCYALIHLLNINDRKKLIQDCYDQLITGGYMIFTVISKKAQTFGQGRLLSKDRYEMFGGATIFFYDEDSINAEFGDAGVSQVIEIEENYPCYLIICEKK